MARALSFAFALLAAVTAAPGARAAEPAPAPEARALAEALRGGGLVLYMRHAQTERSQTDADALDLDDCATQRNLSEAGRRAAAALGAALRSVGAAIDRAVTSEYCRARETAALMGLAAMVEADGGLNDGGRMVASGPDSPQAEAVRALLRTPPAPGRNTVVVAHRPNLADAAGPAFGNLAEGEVAAFAPAAERPGFRAVGRIAPEDWPGIVAAAGGGGRD